MSQRIIKKYVAAKDTRPHVMIAPLTGAERHAWINPLLVTAIVSSTYRRDIKTFSFSPAFGVFPVSAARNKVVEEYFLTSDADWLVMIDNDIAPDQNFLDMLFDCPEDADILIAPYYVWDPILMRPMICFGRWEDGRMITLDPTEVKPGWFGGKAAGGTGLIAIRRRAFTDSTLEKPFFRIICDDYEGQTMTEDIYFTGKAAEAGLKIYTNAKYIVKHFHTIDLTEINFGICTLVNQYVDKVQSKYKDAGVELKSLSGELHPELLKGSINA